MQKTDIRSMEYGELKELVAELSSPKFRADQIFGWLHKNAVNSFDEMTNIPADLRKKLEEIAEIRNAKIKDIRISKIDGSRKYLFKMNDGALIESVFMRYKHGNSVCVSSQVGCNMGCAFCASTIDGCKRNLEASEILEQVYEIQKDTKERVSNIVVMGMGEPMLNYDNVIRFVKLITDENSLHISQRNITISTCGLVPAIRRMAEESLKVTLALSLHAPNDEIRAQIMPVARKYSIKETLEACDHYFDLTGRRVTFEYCLIKGVNDSVGNAKELAALLRGRNAHVNLIPVNPTPENKFGQMDEKQVESFRSVLERGSINVTRRREIGRDIEGACGQLVRRKS